MTAEIVNLNKVRKARERANRERDAQENRIKYGQPKSERNLFDARNRKWQHDLDGSRLTSDGFDDDDTGPDVVLENPIGEDVGGMSSALGDEVREAPAQPARQLGTRDLDEASALDAARRERGIVLARNPDRHVAPG